MSLAPITHIHFDSRASFEAACEEICAAWTDSGDDYLSADWGRGWEGGMPAYITTGCVRDDLEDRIIRLARTAQVTS